MLYVCRAANDVSCSWIVRNVRDRCLGCIVTFLKAAALDESYGGMSDRLGKYSAGALENYIPDIPVLMPCLCPAAHLCQSLLKFY